MRDVFWRPFIENALWTLEIEVHFYLICFLFAFFQGYKRASVLIAASLGFALAAGWFYPRAETLAINNLGAYKLSTVICENGAYITFMFVGTCLYNWKAGNWSGRKTAATVLVLMVIYNYCLEHIATTHAYASYVYANHVSVLLFFSLLMLLNDRIPFSNILNKIADISYPLYLMHGVAGFVVFYMTFKKTASFYISISAASGWVVVTSLALNHFIEKPAIRLGKKITQEPGSFLRLLPRRVFTKPKVFPLE